MAGPANPAAPKGGFNKLFVMVPVMLAARKLDSEDPATVQYLRIAYGSVQSICVLVVFYIFMKASSLKGPDPTIYVPAPPTPFADPDSKNKYTRVQYAAHVASTARSLLGSTLFGICMTVGLHIYKGMAMGLAMQAIMGPFNLFENSLVKALFLGNGFNPADKIFDEKSLEELDVGDEVVDEAGNAIPKALLSPSTKKPNSFEELILDTWDEGASGDLTKFVKAITKENCNYRTKESGWTPLMILSGLLRSDETAELIKSVVEIGGNPSITDGEGWNSLHWAAYHGMLCAAKVLYEIDADLSNVKDNEGKLPLEVAQDEKNEDVAKYLEEAIASAAAVSKADDDEGIRKRK